MHRPKSRQLACKLIFRNCPACNVVLFNYLEAPLLSCKQSINYRRITVLLVKISAHPVNWPWRLNWPPTGPLCQFWPCRGKLAPPLGMLPWPDGLNWPRPKLGSGRGLFRFLDLRIFNFRNFNSRKIPYIFKFGFQHLPRLKVALY